MKKFESLAGVPVHYDRRFEGDYGTRGDPSKWLATPEFKDKLDAFFEELWQVCPLGKAEVIATAGTFAAKPGFHGTGEAFDLDCIFWSNKAFVTKKYPVDKKFYLGVEAVLRKHFGQVLDFHYNAAHRDHFHADIGQEVGFRRATSLINFLQAVLKEVFLEFVEIDGLFGPQTDGALDRVLQHLGIHGNLNDLNNWKNLLDQTAQEAFKPPEGGVLMMKKTVTEASSPLDLLREVYFVLTKELADNESYKTIEAALTQFAQHDETEKWLKKFRHAS